MQSTDDRLVSSLVVVGVYTACFIGLYLLLQILEYLPLTMFGALTPMIEAFMGLLVIIVAATLAAYI